MLSLSLTVFSYRLDRNIRTYRNNSVFIRLPGVPIWFSDIGTNGNKHLTLFPILITQYLPMRDSMPFPFQLFHDIPNPNLIWAFPLILILKLQSMREDLFQSNCLHILQKSTNWNHPGIILIPIPLKSCHRLDCSFSQKIRFLLLIKKKCLCQQRM